MPLISETQTIKTKSSLTSGRPALLVLAKYTGPVRETLNLSGRCVVSLKASKDLVLISRAKGTQAHTHLELIEDYLVSGEVDIQLLVPESVVGARLGSSACQPCPRVGHRGIGSQLRQRDKHVHVSTI